MKILLDTNFLVYCAKQKIDYIEEIDRIFDFKYEIIILSNVIKELEELAGKKDKDSNNALLSLAVLSKNIEENKISKIEAEEKRPDKSFEKISEKEKVVVATMDKELKEKLKKMDTKILSIRGAKTLKIL
jgi:rRNA-processing protein FCF1